MANLTKVVHVQLQTLMLWPKFYDKTRLVVYMYKIKGLFKLPSISNPHIFQAKKPTSFLFTGLIATPCILYFRRDPSITGCVACTGLVCFMHWTGVMYVLDWPDPSNAPALYIIHCVVCTRLVCCMRGGRKGVGHCPCTFIKEGGWWW